MYIYSLTPYNKRKMEVAMSQATTREDDAARTSKFVYTDDDEIVYDYDREDDEGETSK